MAKTAKKQASAKKPVSRPAAPAAKATPGDLLSLGSLQEIVALMAKNGLTEVNLEGNGQSIYLSRQVNQAGAPAPASPQFYAAPAQIAAGAPAPAAQAAPAAAPAAKADTISSQMVGTFYPSSGPDAKPFVKVGDAVTADTVVCIVEAMKVFNEIKAGKSGVIAKILVESGKPVEFGTPMFELK